MSDYQRPWWLVVNKPAGLVTTIQEESRLGERVFRVRGEPVVQGLAWLTWGPLGALLAIAGLTWLAVVWQINQQAVAIRGLFIMAFLVLPALVWLGLVLVFTRLAAKYVQAERQTGTVDYVIRLSRAEEALFYQTVAMPTPEKVAYHNIRQVRVTHAIGERSAKAWRLALETTAGDLVLLNEAVGTHTQKIDLATEIERGLAGYREKL